MGFPVHHPRQTLTQLPAVETLDGPVPSTAIKVRCQVGDREDRKLLIYTTVVDKKSCRSVFVLRSYYDSIIDRSERTQESYHIPYRPLDNTYAFPFEHVTIFQLHHSHMGYVPSSPLRTATNAHWL